MFNNSLLNTFLSNCLFSIISFVYVFFLICLFPLTMSYSFDNVLFVLDHGQLDCKLCALAEVALYRDVALV